MFQVDVQKNQAVVTETEPMTTGSSNVYVVQFTFSKEWTALARTAVFRNGDVIIDVLLDDTNRCMIPWEVMANQGTVDVGVFGTMNGNVVLPTIWASAGNMQIGVVTGVTPSEPTPDVYQQILDKISNLESGGGVPYVDLLVAPPDTYSAHDVESIIGQSLYYVTWSGDPMKTVGELEVGKEFTAYFLYDGEQLNPTLRYYGVFVCDEYDPVSTERIKATLKDATLIGNRTESLNSFLTFFKLDAVPELNVTTSIPFTSAVGVMPQWMNTPHRGLMTVENNLYLIDFRLEWLDHDNEMFKVKFTGVYPISNSGSSTGDNSFITIKDQEIKTPNDFTAVFGTNSYTGCVHAINTTIPGSVFANDIVWIYYRRISGTYYLTFVTIDGLYEEWESASSSTDFSSVRRTDFILEDQLDLAEGTTFIGYFATLPEVESIASMQPDWFIGKKPTAGGRYSGKIRDDANKWYDMVINVLGTTDYEGTQMYETRIVRVTEENGGGGASVKMPLVILLSSDWDEDKKQTISVTGVKADESAQAIHPMPAIANQNSYYSSGVLCINQAENSLTFQADTIPTEDLSVYVEIQEVGNGNI